MKVLKENAFKIRFYECLNVYNILMYDVMQQDFKQVKICVMYKWQAM